MMKMTDVDADKWFESLSGHDKKRVVGLACTDKTGVSRKKSDGAAINYLMKQPVAEVNCILENIVNTSVLVGPSSVGDDAVSRKICVNKASEQAHLTFGGDGSIDRFRIVGGKIADFIIEKATDLLADIPGAVMEKHSLKDNKPDWGAKGNLALGTGFAWNRIAGPVMKRIISVKSFAELRGLAPLVAVATTSVVVSGGTGDVAGASGGAVAVDKPAVVQEAADAPRTDTDADGMVAAEDDKASGDDKAAGTAETPAATVVALKTANGNGSDDDDE